MAKNVPTTSSEAFHNTDITNVTLHVPDGTLGAYMKAEPWKFLGCIVDESGNTAAGIAMVDISGKTVPVATYSLSGAPVRDGSLGPVIVRMPDGSVRKVMRGL